jgi:tetratricopeptide (TPR) repeat protein
VARKLKVFLSSTAQDLTAFRKAVHARLVANPLFDCIRQEDFGAHPHPAPAVCKAEVEKADLFVGLIGMRRGWEPSDDNPERRSITEMEYDWAKEIAPRFMHVSPDDFLVPANRRESNEEHERQIAFRQRVMGEIVVSQEGFVSAEGLPTPNVLAQLVVDQLTNYVLENDQFLHRIRPPPPPAAPNSLPDAVAERILHLLDQRGELLRAERGGLERDIVFKLAKRLRPDDTLDFDRAVAELENAITIAVETIARGQRGGNENDLVNDVLKSLATHTQTGENERAAKAVDDALKELDAREIEQRENLNRSRLTLLEAGIKQDILRRDASSAAQRVAQVVAIEHPTDLSQRFAVLRERQSEFHIEGRDKGINLSLDIAIEIARHGFVVAQSADQRAVILNDLGNSLWRLGERESSTARLYEAIKAYHDALKENTRDRAPLDWAMTQNNLGNALQTVAPLETDNTIARLNEAVHAYRESLKEYTRELTPVDWARTQSNLGNALSTLGEVESGTARLHEAVAAFRDALTVRIRERAPLEWATTQDSLGTALSTLGERESGTVRLEEAITAYREALKERTRERVPLQFAMSTGNQGVALMRLAERRDEPAMAAISVSQIEEALSVMRGASHVPFAQYYETQLSKARSILARLNQI